MEADLAIGVEEGTGDFAFALFIGALVEVVEFALERDFLAARFVGGGDGTLGSSSKLTCCGACVTTTSSNDCISGASGRGRLSARAAAGTLPGSSIGEETGSGSVFSGERIGNGSDVEVGNDDALRIS